MMMVQGHPRDRIIYIMWDRYGVRKDVVSRDYEWAKEQVMQDAQMGYEHSGMQRAIDLVRVDNAISAIQPETEKGIVEAISTLEKLLQRREKLLGHYPKN